MIGKAEWFSRRKYGGWGLRPKTWQGWLYVVLLILPPTVITMWASLSDTVKVKFTLMWLGFLIVDMTHIMITLNRDEREHKIEAISERNAAWAMVGVLILGIMYQIFSSLWTGVVRVDWFLFAALIVGALVKSISNYGLGKKDL